MIQSISQTGGVKNKMGSGIVLTTMCSNKLPTLPTSIVNKIMHRNYILISRMIFLTLLHNYTLIVNCRLKDGPFSSRKLPQIHNEKLSDK